MKTDDQILRICRRILAREGYKIAKRKTGYIVHHESEPVSEGQFCWKIDQIIDLTDVTAERQAEYKQEQRQGQREHRADRAGRSA